MESMSLVLTIIEWEAPNSKMSQIKVWPFLLIVELSPLPLIGALWQLEFHISVEELWLYEFSSKWLETSSLKVILEILNEFLETTRF